MSTEQGVDVSNWQGRIDWDEAHKQLGFAMVKASEGLDYVDPDYARNIDALRSMNEPRGSYHFPACAAPRAEALHYVRTANKRANEMQALDFEGPVLDFEDPVGWAWHWLDEVRNLTGNTPLIYMSGSVVTRFNWRPVVELGAGLWVASWGEQPAAHHLGAWPFAIMWQRSDDGSLHGVHGDVDQDVFYGDADTWRRYASADIYHRDPQPAPHPQPGPAPEPSHPAEPDIYVVREGDTLLRIAHAHHVTEEHIVRLNVERYPSLSWNRNLIQIGWKLLIP